LEWRRKWKNYFEFDLGRGFDSDDTEEMEVAKFYVQCWALVLTVLNFLVLLS
jgi:hypothetical protein